MHAKITKYSHFFKVENVSPLFHALIIDRALRELVPIKYVKIRGRKVREKGKPFLARTADRSQYRFHINYWSIFETYLKSAKFNEHLIEVIEEPLYEPVDIDVKMPTEVSLRDYQEKGVEYISDEGVSKLVTFATGQGKTFTALAAGEVIGKRTLIMVLGRYTEKWIEDVQGAYGETCSIVFIKGGSQLLSLIETAKQGKDLPDVIIVTITTISRYIKEWEQTQHLPNCELIPPEELYKTLGIGYRIIDEAHQHFHAVFKNDLYTHCPKTLYLTATLDTNDRFMSFIYLLMWPTVMRSVAPKPPAYDETVVLHYHHQKPELIRCMGPQGYSHVLYEQSLWKHVPSRCQYLDMIGNVVEDYFLPLYEPGKKMLIFCALVDTCQYVSDYLNNRFSEMQWKISKFTAGDPKSVIDTNDITVSTLGKSGTALDISGLVITLMTVALSEPKANKQAKGRLRDLSKKPGFEHITPVFLYFCGDDIERHRVYDKQKRLLFDPITKSIKDVYLGQCIGEPFKSYFDSGYEPRWKAWGVKQKHGD